MANSTIKFSVVIPVYNVEKYIDSCLKSILNQSYRNIEVILVDDESPDNCPMICDYYASIDERVKVIHKKNGGLGMARNTGIDNATGDYICFFDSDDFVSNDLFQICYDKLANDQFDVLHFDYAYFDGDILKNKYSRKNDTIFEGKEVVDVFFKKMIYNPDNKERLLSSACNKMYSLKLIQNNNFRFFSEREFVSEDYYSNLFLYKHVKSVLCIPNVLYFYRSNTSSLTHFYDDKRFEKNMFQYEKSIQACDELCYGQEIRDALAKQMFTNMLGSFRMLLLNEQLDKLEKKKKVYEVVDSKAFGRLWKDLKPNGEKFSWKLMFWCLKKHHPGLMFRLLMLKYGK